MLRLKANPMDLKPVVSASLVDTVVERIRGVIEQGGLKPGDRLPSEMELVQRLGVSRNAVREAVVRLEVIGILTIQRGRGMFVGSRESVSHCAQLIRSAIAISSSKDLTQFIEFRTAIECHAAREAAAKAEPDDVAELEAYYRRMCDQELDYDTVVAADFQFHKKLLTIAGNELMLNVIEVIQEFMVASIVRPMPPADSPTNRRLSAEQKRRYHLPVLKAIRARDPEAADRGMRSHMEFVAGQIRKKEPRLKNGTVANGSQKQEGATD